MTFKAYFGSVESVKVSPRAKSAVNHPSTTHWPWNISAVTFMCLQKPSLEADAKANPSLTQKYISSASFLNTVYSLISLARGLFNLLMTWPSTEPSKCWMAESWSGVIYRTEYNHPVDPVPVAIIKPELLNRPISTPSGVILYLLAYPISYSAQKVSFKHSILHSSG